MALKRKFNLGFRANPDNVNLSALQIPGQLGGIHEAKDARWQCFQLVDAGPAVAGDVGYSKLSGTSLLYGQATRTIGNSLADLICGIFTNAVTLNYFTLLRLGGSFDCKSEAGLDGAGDVAFPHTANNALTGANRDPAATTGAMIIPVGTALAARNGGTGKTVTYLNIPYVG